MAQADLHVHSWFSDHPSEWFLQRIGANESYTDPEYIYSTALERGMDFVTITDHNAIQGALELKERHPDNVFVSVEATSYFPEDGCKVHILVYGLTESQFAEVQKYRRNVYDLRDYLRAEGLAHSVAHATYAVNGRLEIVHLEKLLLLFNVFEGINGMRAKMSNAAWMCVLENLTEDHISALYDTHRIEPFGDTPWEKGLTGGSDDHGGLFMGTTATVADAATVNEFIAALTERKTLPSGRHNDYRSLAFTIYKIAYEFSRARSTGASKSLLGQLTELVFNGGSLSFTNRLKMRKIKSFGTPDPDSIQAKVVELIDTIRARKDESIDSKFSIVYDKVADISDAFFVNFAKSLVESAEKGDVAELVRNISSSIPGVFLSVPFFTTLSHMCQGRALTNQLLEEFDIRPGNTTRVLWFTDKITDLDSTSEMVKKLGWEAYRAGRAVKIITALPDEEVTPSLPPNVLRLPYIYEFALPTGESEKLRVPSVLKSLQDIFAFEPDEIVISTPGPVGLLGMLAGRLLKVRTTGVYHAEYAELDEAPADDDSLSPVLSSYAQWFYSMMDDIRVPARSCIERLGARGYDRRKMSLFPRGIDGDLFRPDNAARVKLAERYGIQPGVTLCYAGGVAQNRHLDFLFDVYTALAAERDDLNLVIAGDGSAREMYEERMRGHDRVTFTGPVPREDLPVVYGGADILLFPGRTDTFGLPILEAQACGVPAIVADMGSAGDIVDHGATGFVMPSHDVAGWAAQVKDVLSLIDTDPDGYGRMCTAARERAVEKFGWDAVLRDMLDGASGSDEKQVEDRPVEENMESREPALAVG